MVPPNLFHSKAISNNLVKLPMEAGISPDSLFPIKPIISIFWSLQKLVGMMPVNLLSFKIKTIKLTKFPNDVGILPDISLNAKDKYVSWVDKLDIELGKTPPNWFVAKSKYWSLLQFVKDIKKRKPLLDNFLSNLAWKDPVDFPNLLELILKECSHLINYSKLSCIA